MTEERHECKTYAEMLAVLREAKADGQHGMVEQRGTKKRRTDRLRQEGQEGQKGE